MNLDSLSNEELKQYHRKLSDTYVETFRDRGVGVAILFFYGIFACVGMLIWCVETALQYQDPFVKYLNYTLIISGAISLYFAHKKDKDNIVTKTLIKEQLANVNHEINKRGIL